MVKNISTCIHDLYTLLWDQQNWRTIDTISELLDPKKEKSRTRFNFEIFDQQDQGGKSGSKPGHEGRRRGTPCQARSGWHWVKFSGAKRLKKYKEFSCAKLEIVKSVKSCQVRSAWKIINKLSGAKRLRNRINCQARSAWEHCLRNGKNLSGAKRLKTREELSGVPTSKGWPSQRHKFDVISDFVLLHWCTIII